MEGLQNKSVTRKFSNPEVTAKGEVRAWVEPQVLETLWFNTGTLCNLECKNCYIESSPKNDRLEYITLKEVIVYLEEIKAKKFNTKEIGFTGGEPFLNKQMTSILKECLGRGFEVMVLTNAMKPMMKQSAELLSLNKKYPDLLKIRVSLDHYREEMHSEERGPKAWQPAIKGLQWLSDNGFDISVAGRTIWGETDSSMREGFSQMFKSIGVKINSNDPKQLVLFPEMDEKIEVPEITTSCWDILKKNPKDIMCASSRMVVKRKGDRLPSVMACTLLAYDQRFNMGITLEEAWKSVKLNHPHCAKFCVLGGGSCGG